MGVVRTILLVAFVIVCVLLVLLVLVQNEDSNGMGSIFGGNSAAFGSRSASVLTKTTGVLVALFFVFAFCLALLNKAPKKEVIEGTTAVEAESDTNSSDNKWFMNSEDDAESPAESNVDEASAEESTVEESAE